MEQAARGNSPAGSSSPDTAGWNATFDRDVAMYKQEPQSQVSSTDSGYGQGHAERVHDYKPGYPGKKICWKSMNLKIKAMDFDVTFMMGVDFHFLLH